jgi:histidinol-phosphate aminotransferase
MSDEYKKPAASRAGLRLHMNENTGGCSPAVLDALRGLTCADAAFYNDASEAVDACARYLGVSPRQVVLTNGLDEGILCACVAALKNGTFEAVVVVPTFEMYGISAAAAGGRVIEVPQPADFSFPLPAVLAAINEMTRIVFLTTPNNPTGQSIPRESILAIADAAPHALIFVDEAYADFSGTTLIGDADAVRRTNVIVGRTFAKAFGLAGLRVGALVGSVETLNRIRPVVPPYNVNIAAAVALPAALNDTAHHQWYLDQAEESKSLLYAALDRRGIPYWRSDANFVLARFGADAARVVAALNERGIHIRHRQGEHGCEGCVRITAGIVEHTRRCIAAIEDVL